MFLLVLALRASSRGVKSSRREAESPSAENRLGCHAGSWVTAKAFVNGPVWPTWNRAPGAGAEWGARSRCCVSGSSTHVSLFSEPRPPPLPCRVSTPCVSTTGGSGGGYVGERFRFWPHPLPALWSCKSWKLRDSGLPSVKWG